MIGYDKLAYYLTGCLLWIFMMQWRYKIHKNKWILIIGLISTPIIGVIWPPLIMAVYTYLLFDDAERTRPNADTNYDPESDFYQSGGRL